MDRMPEGFNGKPDAVVIGNLTIDYVGGGGRRLGGPPSYCGIFLAPRTKVSVISNIGYDFPSGWIESLEDIGVDVSGVRTTPESAVFELKEEANGRSITVTSSGIPIPPESVDITIDIGIASPVLGEIGPSLLEILRKRASFLAVDLQGFVRTREENGTVIFGAKEGTLENFPGVDLIKGSMREAGAVTSRRDPSEALNRLRKYGEVAAITLGEAGAVVGYENENILIPPFEISDTKDATGSGDVFLAALALLIFTGEGIEQASAYACAAASINTQEPGPFVYYDEEVIIKRAGVIKRGIKRL